MAAEQDFFRSIPRPFIFKKKFFIYYGIFTLILAIVGVVWYWINYQKQQSGVHMRESDVTGPLTLPLLALAIYVIIILMWILTVVLRFKNYMYRRIPSVFQAAPIQLHPGESVLSEVKISARISPGAISKIGAFRITNFRMMHTPTIDMQRVGILLGANEPDLTYTIPHPNIRQCGFGLDQKHPKYFVVIDTNGVQHSFTQVKPHDVEGAMNALGWKRTQYSNEVVFWLQN